MTKYFVSREEALSRLDDEFDFDDQYGETCPEIAYQMLMEGRTQAEIASTFKVTERTIQNWKKPKLENGKPNPRYRPEFARCYLLGYTAYKAFFDDIARTNLKHPNKHFNPQLLMNEMRRRFGIPDQRVLDIPGLKEAKSYKAQARVVLENLTHGNLTVDELQKIMHALHNFESMVEMEELKNEIQDLKEAAK